MTSRIVKYKFEVYLVSAEVKALAGSQLLEDGCIGGCVYAFVSAKSVKAAVQIVQKSLERLNYQIIEIESAYEYEAVLGMSQNIKLPTML